MKPMMWMLAVSGLCLGLVGCSSGRTGLFNRGAACGCSYEPGCAYEAPVYNGTTIPAPPPTTVETLPAR